MKKVIIGMVLLVFILGGCGCAVSDSSVTKNGSEISINDASNLVRQVLPKREYSYHVEYEGIAMFEEKEYYTFRAFTVSSQIISDTETNTPVQMQFTHGIYYVNPSTEEVFELSTGGDKLINKSGDGSAVLRHAEI